ncbi:hypothetical protein CPB86DRAFT_855257 [Serendipita vermifera]|nr:hypothetical protein CPB86DRAFT_855257 [Serendipita vermifera]
MTTHIRLSLYLMDQWTTVLSIPREEFVKYTTRPLKWLRYLGSTIYGREGTLKGGPYDGEIEDYTIEDVDTLLSGYFYYSTGYPQLVDMNMIDKCKSPGPMSPLATCSSFDEEITARDGACVVTGLDDELCEAAHIIPHRRGDAYIEVLTRSRANSEDDVIREINDPRNGITLFGYLKILLRRGDIAFIKTPKFAMSPEDIPRIAEYPIHRAGSQPSHLPTRWTMQYFDEQETVVHVRDKIQIHHNTDLFFPEDLTRCPSALVLDMLYGCLAVYRFNVPLPNPDSDSVQQGGLGEEKDQAGIQDEGQDSVYNHLLGDTTYGPVTLKKI